MRTESAGKYCKRYALSVSVSNWFRFLFLCRKWANLKRMVMVNTSKRLWMNISIFSPLHCHCRCCVFAYCTFSVFEMVTTFKRDTGGNSVGWIGYVEQLFQLLQNFNNLEQKLCYRIHIRFAVVLWPSMNLNCFLKERFFYQEKNSFQLFDIFILSFFIWTWGPVLFVILGINFVRNRRVHWNQKSSVNFNISNQRECKQFTFKCLIRF